jgi:hypothetical protein
VNQERACGATGIIPAVRLAEEASRLRSLKVQPKYLAQDRRVRFCMMAILDSMPPEAISMPAALYLYADRIRIVAGKYEANHPGRFVAYEGSTLAAHRAALVAAVSGQRGKRYLNRQQLLELGELGSTTSVACTTSYRAMEQKFFAAPWTRDSKSKFLVPPTLSIFLSVH